MSIKQYEITGNLGGWLSPSGKFISPTNEEQDHAEMARRILKAKGRKNIGIGEEIYLLLKLGWIRVDNDSFQVDKLTRKEKDIIFMWAKDQHLSKITVDTMDDPILINQPPEDLYERRIKLVDLLEMALPTKEMADRNYYHGTPSAAAAKQIIKQGIQPQDMEFLNKKYKDMMGEMPVQNTIYLTTDIFTAMSYAAGTPNELYDFSFKKPGYIFIVSGKKLKNITMDEDRISILFLMGKLDNILTNEQKKKVMSLRGVETGKYLLTIVNDKTIQQLINKYGKKMFTIAHIGTIKPNQCWEINRSAFIRLDLDNINEQEFFRVAKRIY